MLDVLVVDDDTIVRGGIAEALASAGHRVTEASDGEAAMGLFASRAFDVAICDVHMPKMDGLTLCRRLRRDAPGTALVLMTSYGNVSDAVASLRGGVIDYVSKPFDPDEFVATVLGPIAERHSLRKKFEEVRSEFVRREAGGTLVGTSIVMRQLAEGIAIAARHDSSVLVSGERGTGKKLVARMIHAASPRRAGSLVVVPCADLPDLILSAGEHRDEWFRSAAGGTLVLDGVERLSVEAQTRLARCLDEPSLRARRDRDWQPLGVRMISVMTEDPQDPALRHGFPRRHLDGLRLRVPSLRERDGDLYVLVGHFLRELTPPARSAPCLTPRAWKALALASLPGNVRELVWVLEHAIAHSDGGEIDVQHLPEEGLSPWP